MPLSLLGFTLFHQKGNESKDNVNRTVVCMPAALAVHVLRNSSSTMLQ